MSANRTRFIELLVASIAGAIVSKLLDVIFYSTPTTGIGDMILRPVLFSVLVLVVVGFLFFVGMYEKPKKVKSAKA